MNRNFFANHVMRLVNEMAMTEEEGAECLHEWDRLETLILKQKEEEKKELGTVEEKKNEKEE